MMAFHNISGKGRAVSNGNCSKPEVWAPKQPKKEYQPRLSTEGKQVKTEDSLESPKRDNTDHQNVRKTVEAVDMSTTEMVDYKQSASPSMQEVTSPEEKAVTASITGEDNRPCVPHAITSSSKEDAQKTHKKGELDDVQARGGMTDKHSSAEAACTLPDFSEKNANSSQPDKDQGTDVHNKHPPTQDDSGKALTSNGTNEETSPSLKDLPIAMAIAMAWSKPIHGEERMNGNVGKAPIQEESDKENQGNCRKNV